MNFNFETVKATFAAFNIQQKIAAVVLALAVPVSIGLGVSGMGAGNESEIVESMSQPSSIVSMAPSSSTAPSSSSVSKKAVKVTLLPSSVEEDLEVKVIGPDGNMLVGPEFQLIVKGAKNGYNKTWKVNDGFLRLTKLPSGDYTVSIKEIDGYIVPEEDVKITVAKKVAYKEVDVSDKVVDESKIDVSKEDAAYDNQVVAPATPAPVKDTVEYVASSKKTEKKEVEVITVKYKPAKILEDGTMANNAGVSSGLYPRLDKDGYLIGAYRYETKPSASPAAEVSVMPVQLLTLHAWALENSLGNTGIMPLDEGDGTAEPTTEPTAEPTAAPTAAPTATPTAEPTATPTATPTAEPTAEPTATPTPVPEVTATPEVTPTATPEVTPTATPTAEPTASPSPTPTVTPTATPTATPTVSPTPENRVEVEVDIFDEDGNPIKDSLGNTLVKLKTEEIKTKEKKDVTTYYGWQTIDGAKYYFDKNGEKVKGTQTIQGITYYFDKDGKMGNRIGIDISKYQPNINWQTVKDSGVEFVIIRAGYRGYGSGALVEDPYFKRHIQGATSVGLKVGVYVFSQAITTQEAVEEASLALQLVKGYNISYPIFFDSEYSTSRKTGRADGLSQSQRTTIAKAFCETIQNAGYNAGIYASKTWFYYQLDYSQISQYDIWVAHYASSTDFKYRYDIWQYTGTGTCAGVAGAVDLNIGYTAY